MIDSHCHLDHEPLKSNLGEVIDRSKKMLGWVPLVKLESWLEKNS